jgi:uncharacterized damage-inducible protein DinB
MKLEIPLPLYYWTNIRQALYDALDLITDDQLKFIPADGLWSLGKVVLHIAGCENGWFRYIITREVNDWPEDFASKDYSTVSSVKGLLAQVHARSQDYLASISREEQQRIIEAPWGSKFPVNYAIWHIIEHEIHHRGEIFLMLGLMGMEAPDV